MIPEPVSSRSAAENRRFSTRGAVAGLTTPLVATPAALAQGAERVGFAVVGLGSFALNQIIPSFGDARLAALVSGSTDKAGTVGRTFGVAEERRHTYDDFDRIARDPTVRVVHVITPNALHEELVVRAAEVGKQVLCEKPMAATPEACERMIAACREAGRKPTIAYRAQYEPYNLKAIELCRRGELDKIKLVTSDHGRTLDPEDPADQRRMSRDLAGGGSLVDIDIYSLQVARYVTGGSRSRSNPPRATRAFARSRRPACSSSASPRARWPAARRPTANPR